MARKSPVDKELEKLDAEIAILQAVRVRLVESQAVKRAQKPAPMFDAVAFEAAGKTA